MPSDLASYLATHYLTADPKPAKKRKRKHKDDAGGGGGLLIQDDDDPGWTAAELAGAGGGGGGGDADGDLPMTVAGMSAEFRKASKSNWKSIGGGDAARQADDDAAAAADAILASAAAEKAAAAAADEDAPVVEAPPSPAQKMADGTHAGIQSAAAVAAQLERRRREERAAFERERRDARAAGRPDEAEGETVYRDATGRRVDVSMQRAAARRAAAEAEERERAAREALRGDVQRGEARRRREALEGAALLPLARRADDEDLNRELRARQRWNDPMAQFAAGDGDGGEGAKKARRGPRRPVYPGAAPPNRYGIRPGHRWDGVDRGNGFEAERFKAINRRERNKGLEYSWQMDE